MTTSADFGEFEDAVKRFWLVLLRQVEGVIRKIPSDHHLILAVVVQISLVLLANGCAFLLRFEGQTPLELVQLGLKCMPIVAAVYGVGLWAFGIQRGLWRYVGFHDFKLILCSMAASATVFFGIMQVLGWTAYPRSVIILTSVLSVIFLGGVRVMVRIIREGLAEASAYKKRVLIVGAGSAGEMLVRDLMRDVTCNYRPVGFVDDAAYKQERTIHGIPVLGFIEDIPTLAMRHAVNEIVVAIPNAKAELMQRVLMASATCRLPIKTLPSIKQILDNPISIRQIRPLLLEDLLQREPIQTDIKELCPLLEGRRILITGAGGSIGSELCRQIAQYRPACLALLERHENSLYALELELRGSFPQTEISAIVCDITDARGVQDELRAFAPQLVFHAAGHKHVPLMEYSEREAIRNNILGTQVVMRAAQKVGVDRFVLISTDKAVNPTNVMGATKRVAEYLAQEMNRGGGTRFTVVRFGNVLGSSGSVVPLFAQQIRQGGPVKVTHQDVRRYFMTIPEAVQLILQASVRGQGGDIFVLDMGEQVRIVDLARNMIVLSGLTPDRDIKMTFTGLRPGEKLSEELFEQGEQVESTSHDKIKRAVSRMPFEADELSRRVAELEVSLAQPGPVAFLDELQALVPSYRPSRPKQAL